METWFLVVVSLCISFLIKSIISVTKTKPNLPPGPLSLPLIGNPIWLRKPISELETILRGLKPRFGPLVTVTISSRPLIFVGDHSLAHDALVHNGSIFADRPSPQPTARVFDRSQMTISGSGYGATWRLLRRNLTREVLHPSRVKSHSTSRRWVLQILVQKLHESVRSDASVTLIDHFQYAMFCLLVFMCFGDSKLEEFKIREIEQIQRKILLGFPRFNILNFWPRLGKIVFRQRWKEITQLREEQESIFVPLIKSRIEMLKSKSKTNLNEENQQTGNDEDDDNDFVAYVDSLLNLKLTEEGDRNLYEYEMVSLCSEFLNAGTDTTSTALQWTMANLVKHQEIQTKLYQEIVSVVGKFDPEIKKQIVEEDDATKMPYLRAVVLESLRRHPPGHFVLPHKTTQDIELGNHTIPKNSTVNFMVADMNWDPKVWDDPMDFRPERFISEESFDITCSREIKMMPFGVGRRMCPAYALALLHLEYFVANLIWRFEWRVVEGDGVDLSEKAEFTIVMKNPLKACILPRN